MSEGVLFEADGVGLYVKRKMKKKLIFLCIYDVKLVLPAAHSRRQRRRAVLGV